MRVIDTTPGHRALRSDRPESIADTTLVAALQESGSFSEDTARRIVADLFDGLESLALATP